MSAILFRPLNELGKYVCNVVFITSDYMNFIMFTLNNMLISHYQDYTMLIKSLSVLDTERVTRDTCNMYRKVSNIRRTKSQNLNASRLIL